MTNPPSPIKPHPAPPPADEEYSFFKRVKFVIVGAVQEWINKRAASKGAALAFYTLFSMAPILVLVIAIAGAFFGMEAARGAIFSQLKGLVGPAGAEAIQLLVAGARNTDAGRIATIVASIILLIGATTAFAELKDSLDEIWEVPKSEESGIIGVLRVRLLSFGLVLVLAFLLMVSLVVSAALAVLERYWGGIWSEAQFILKPLSWGFSFTVIAVLFAVIYKMLPALHLSWHDVWIGSVITAGLFILGKYVIGIYLGNSGVANSYGAAGSVIALLLWVYYSAQIFFLGAEFTHQYALWFGSQRSHRKASKSAIATTRSAA